MTVSAGVRSVAYTGNGATKTFPVPYQFFELIASVNNVVKTNGIDFTVAGGNGNPGSITFAVAPAPGTTIVIDGNEVIAQAIDLSDEDPFPADTIEKALDRLTMIAGNLETKFSTTVEAAQSAAVATAAAAAATAAQSASDSSAVAAANSATAAATSASAAASSKTSADTAATNAANSATAADTSKTAAATSATYAANSATAANTSKTNAATSETNAANSATAANTSKNAAATSATAAAASATAAAASAASIVGSVVTPEQYGAVGNGTTDDLAAINAAIAAAGVGGIVDFGPKVYAVSGTITQSIDGVLLRGRQSGGTFSTSPTTNEGTVIRYIGTGSASVLYFGCLAGGSADLCGGGIEGIQFDGGGKSTVVVQLRSCSNSTFTYLKIRNASNTSSSYCLLMDSDVSARPGVNSVYRCNFYQIILDAGVSGNGVLFAGAVDEVGGKHCSFLTVYGIHITHTNGHGVIMTSADTITIHGLGISKVAGGTGKSVRLIPNANRSVTGIVFYNPGLGSNDTPTFEANQSAAGSYCNGIAIYGCAGVDTAPTITLVGGATIERIDYLGHFYSTDPATRGAYSVMPPMRMQNYADADSTALDYYKEKLNNLTLTFGSGNTGITYGANFYRATRIGNLVAFKAQITLTNKGSSTGNAVITGLPYSSVDSWPFSIWANNMTSGVGDTDLQAVCSGSNISLYKMSGGTAVSLTNADFTNTTAIIIAGVYNTNDASA